MIILRLSEIGLPSAHKALGGESLTPSVNVGGGSQAGKGQPRPGHKYVHREWTGDHWEYEYSKEPHAKRHGMGHVGSEEGHTIELPDHLDSGAMHAEEAYNQGRRHKLLTPNTKHQGQMNDGTPIEIHVVPAITNTDRQKKKFPHGVALIIREAPTVNPKTGKVKEGKKLSGTAAGSWAGVEKWMRFEPYKRKLDGDGKLVSESGGEHMYTIQPIVGTPDNVADVLERVGVGANVSRLADEKGRRVNRTGKEINPDKFLVKFENNAPEWVKGAKNNGRRYTTEEGAKNGLRALIANRKGLAETESGQRPPIAQQLQQKEAQRQQAIEAGGSPRNAAVDVLRDGLLPKERDPKNPKNVRVKFDSEEQKQQMMQSLAHEIVKQSSAAYERLMNLDFMQGKRGDQLASEFIGIDVDIGHAGLKAAMQGGNLSPNMFQLREGSPIHKFLNDCINGSYRPEKGELQDYAYATMPRRVLDWARANNVASEGELKLLEGQVESMASQQAAMAAYEGRGEAEQVLQSGGGEEATEEETADLANKIRSWSEEQSQKLDEHEAQDTSLKDDKTYMQMRTAIDQAQNPEHVQQVTEGMRAFLSDRYQSMGLESNVANQIIQNVTATLEKAIKSLTAIFVDHMAAKAIKHDLRMQIMKAKATQPDPTHEYSHREGMDDDPSFLYRDKVGNMIRYTNAPEGSADYSPFGGAPRVHASEPAVAMAPEYFTPDGRKLTRAPHPAAQIQWNPNYHANDPANLWAARWVNPVTGEHEYTYIDSDMRDQRKLRIHQQNRLVDVRLPHLRGYVSGLLHSDQPKDNVIGLMLAMVDQGRVHPVELAKLRSGDVQMNGDVIRFGRFAIHAGEKIQQVVRRMMIVRQPQDPFFSVPVMKDDPNSVIGVDTEFRVIGVHYLVRILARMGTPLGALFSYHATQTYSVQVQRCVQGTNVSLQCGEEFALLEVARRMGHDFEGQPDVNPVIQQIKETMIDPVVIEVIRQSARISGDDQGTEDMTRQVVLAVPHVSANITGLTNAEKEFSAWLHQYPFHEHAEAKRSYEAA